MTSFILYLIKHEPRTLASIVLLVLLVSSVLYCAAANSDELEVTLGGWTEHYINDSSEYNEDNDLIQVTYLTGTWYARASRFDTSYGDPAKSFGFGSAYRPNGDIVLSAGVEFVHGYQNSVNEDLMMGEVLVTPVAAYRHCLLDFGRFGSLSTKLNIIPAAYNLGASYVIPLPF